MLYVIEINDEEAHVVNVQPRYSNRGRELRGDEQPLPARDHVEPTDLVACPMPVRCSV